MAFRVGDEKKVMTNDLYPKETETDIMGCRQVMSLVRLFAARQP